MKTTYLIAAGGTAGHVVPALAVADALRTDGARVIFIGSDRAEAELVPLAGFEFERINVEGLDRSNPLRALRAVVKSIAATVTAWKMIGQLRPAAVLAGGGYVAGPVGAAGPAGPPGPQGQMTYVALPPNMMQQAQAQAQAQAPAPEAAASE